MLQFIENKKKILNFSNNVSEDRLFFPILTRLAVLTHILSNFLVLLHCAVKNMPQQKGFAN